MRATSIAGLFLAVLVLAMSVHPAAAADADATADEEKVVEAVRTLFDAMANDDMVRYREATAPDFHAFDMGQRMTSGQLVEVVEKAREAGVTFTWKVTEPQVHVDGRMAWITYVNRGSFRKGTDTTEMTWLESAVLRKAGDAWRIVFLHSTPVSDG